MSLVNIISAIGNNNTIYPLLVKDCGVEIPTKVALTYKQNVEESPKVAKYAVRERLIDEYATSAVWLGGIPLVEAVANKFIKRKGFNPLVNARLFKEDEVLNTVQGIDYNIKKFSNSTSKIVQDAVADLVKVKDNKRAYQKLMSGKFVAGFSIPMALMGFIIPKAVFALSKKIFDKEKQSSVLQNSNNMSTFDVISKPDMTTFGQKKQVTFGAKFDFASSVANLTTPDKMAAIDGGYALGRVVTARPGYEPFDIAFKMAGMLYLNFVAPKQLEKLFDFTSGRFFKSNVNLDPKLLNNKDFVDAVSQNKFDFLETADAKQMLEYIDNNPNSVFTKVAAKFKQVTMLTKECRDPRAYVNLGELEKFGKNIYSFASEALNSKSVENYAKKATRVKSLNIITNVALSSFLLAYVLPKTQFALREFFTGSKLEPGLINVDKTTKQS